MADPRHFDTRKQANQLRALFGLPPTRSPNASLDTARALVHDVASGYKYCQRLFELIPSPPERLTKRVVRDYLLLVYEWANFVYAAVGAFSDAREQRLGASGTPELMIMAGNATRKLFAGLGVRVGPVVHPRAFVDSARAWTPEERDEALDVVQEVARDLSDVLLPEMHKCSPVETSRSSTAEATHSRDFTSVRWFGTIHHFTKTQAACVRVLWEEWAKGGLGLGEETIGDAIDSQAARFRLSGIFDKGKHPAWGTMIRSVEKGTFRLCSPREDS